MALVLCTGADPTLTHTRQLILEAAGHTVVPALDENQIKEACRKHQFQVAVIGQSGTANSKKEWREIIRNYCPAAKVLEVYTPGAGSVIRDADDSLESPAMPNKLAARVSTLANERDARRATG
jgi:hypothetical protein